MSFQKFIGLGNVCRDIELRFTQGGDAVANFSIAINRTWTAGNGEKREEVTFIEAVAWRKTAEIAEKYLSKGSSVLLEGYFKTDSWEDKQTGQKRSKLVLQVENLRLVGGKQEGASTPPARTAAPPQGKTQPQRDPDLDVNSDREALF